MRRFRSALCALCLALLLPLLIRAARVLPTDSHRLAAEKYAGWSGVLRLWVCEGWESGSGGLSAWLNGCVRRFEKGHPGVYVQPQAVDAAALADFADSGILPPDMLLFSPELLDEPEGLSPLEVPDALRPALAHCGEWSGANYAVPVAMGGYLWAWNAARLSALPRDWRESGATLAVPPPEAGRRYDAALTALCAGMYAEDADAPEAELPGLDLGLAGETSAPTTPPRTLLPCRLPDDFDFDWDAFRRFCNGDVDATIVTQRQARRLQALSEQGKGPDWRLSAGGGAFTDQLLCLGIVEKPDSQRALCEDFLRCLLSDESQTGLSAAGAFAVTGAPSGYAAADPLATMDAALRSSALAAPNVFDGEWPKTAAAIVRELIAGEADSPALWRVLAERLFEKPNIYSQPT